MKRPASLFGLAALLFLAHAGARLAGWAEHTSVLAGMPRSPSSLVLGPAFVLHQLVVVVAVPVLAIAATLDTVLLLRRR